MVSPLAKQAYVSLGPALVLFSQCYILGIYAVMLPKLREPGSTIRLTVDQESWLPSINLLVLFPAQLISGLLTSKYGRRIVFCTSTVITIPACILGYFSHNFTMLFASSILGGLVGGATSIGLLIIAEICSPKIRGTMISAREVFLYLSLAAAHFLGIFFSWRILMLSCLLPTLCGLMITWYSPESPAWLASKGRYDECRTAFIWYRGEHDTEELEQLIECQRQILTKQKMEKQKRSKVKSTVKFLLDKGFWKANVIGFACGMVYPISGKHTFAMYAIDTVTFITGDRNSANYYATLLDLIDFVCICIACFTVNKFKRRTLLISCAIPAVILISGFSLITYLSSIGAISRRHSWIALIIIAAYFALLGISIIPVTFTLCGEVYPLAHRGLGTIVTSSVFVTTSFVLSKITPGLMKSYGVHGLFCINAAGISVVLIVLCLAVPETYNKPLQDIENTMKGVTRVSDVKLKERMIKQQL